MFKNFLLLFSQNIYKFFAMINLLMTRTIMANSKHIFLAVFCVYAYCKATFSCFLVVSHTSEDFVRTIHGQVQPNRSEQAPLY